MQKEIIEFIDPYGKKRKGIEVNCKQCNMVFATRVNRIRKFCSKNCYVLWENSEIFEELTCATCSKKFSSLKSKAINSKSGFRFCSRDCKNTAQRIGGIKEIMPPHYGIGPTPYRKIYKNAFPTDKLQCVRCGYSEFECGIDIHHLDCNKNNNCKNNLIALCSPCHRALHFKCWELEEINFQKRTNDAEDVRTES